MTNKIDHDAVHRLVNKFDMIADNEWNYTVFAAASVFLAELITKADMTDKEQFVDALAANIKSYLRRMDGREQ